MPHTVDDVNGGAVHFDSGSLSVAGDLAIGGIGGIAGNAGAAGVSLGIDDILAADVTTVNDGSTLDIGGGTLDTGILALDGTGAFNFTAGELKVGSNFSAYPVRSA